MLILTRLLTQDSPGPFGPRAANKDTRIRGTRGCRTFDELSTGFRQVEIREPRH